jgi:hypothetical protein
MQVAYRYDEMDGIGPQVCGIIDVALQRPDIGADLGTEPGICDAADSLAFTNRRSSGPGFDDIDTYGRKFCRNFKFLFRV